MPDFSFVFNKKLALILHLYVTNIDFMSKGGYDEKIFVVFSIFVFFFIVGANKCRFNLPLG